MKIKVLKDLVCHDSRENWYELVVGQKLDVELKRHKRDDCGVKMFDILLKDKIAENCSQSSFEVVSDELFVSDFVPSLGSRRRWCKEDRELTIWEDEDDEDDEDEEEEGGEN